MSDQKSQIASHQSPDPRHALVRAAIAECYAAANDGLEAPWDGYTARVLAMWLEANRSWPADVLVRCVRNRFASEEINPAEDPIRWIRKLPNYARGPLDKWQKPKRPGPRTDDDVIADYWRARREHPAR